jgi:hypothetical protein
MVWDLIELPPEGMNMHVQRVLADRKIRSPDEIDQFTPAEDFGRDAHQRFKNRKRFGRQRNRATPDSHFMKIRIQLNSSDPIETAAVGAMTRPSEVGADLCTKEAISFFAMVDAVHSSFEI